MLENILLWTQRQDAAVQCSVGPSQIKGHDPSGHGTDGDGNWNSSSISLVGFCSWWYNFSNNKYHINDHHQTCKITIDSQFRLNWKMFAIKEWIASVVVVTSSEIPPNHRTVNKSNKQSWLEKLSRKRVFSNQINSSSPNQLGLFKLTPKLSLKEFPTPTKQIKDRRPSGATLNVATELWQDWFLC